MEMKSSGFQLMIANYRHSSYLQSVMVHSTMFGCVGMAPQSQKESGCRTVANNSEVNVANFLKFYFSIMLIYCNFFLSLILLKETIWLTLDY